VMNIMFVSVTERTREIGVRKAVGARNADIFDQFLVESVLICVAGGGLGIGVSVSLAILLRHIVHFELVIPGWSVYLAVVTSVVVGFGSGVYPAMRAARLPPIEALRYE